MTKLGLIRARGGCQKFRWDRCRRVCRLGMSGIEVIRAPTRLRCAELLRPCRTCTRTHARALCQFSRSHTRARTCRRSRSYSHARVLVSNPRSYWRRCRSVYSCLLYSGKPGPFRDNGIDNGAIGRRRGAGSCALPHGRYGVPSGLAGHVIDADHARAPLPLHRG